MIGHSENPIIQTYSLGTKTSYRLKTVLLYLGNNVFFRHTHNSSHGNRINCNKIYNSDQKQSLGFSSIIFTFGSQGVKNPTKQGVVHIARTLVKSQVIFNEQYKIN